MQTRTASLILVHKDKRDGEYYVFVHQRTFNTHCGKGMIGVPGGHAEAIDMGDPVKTALREAYEECGYNFMERGTPVIVSGPAGTHVDVLMISDIKWNGIPLSIKTPNETTDTFTTNVHHHDWVKIKDMCSNMIKNIPIWYRTKTSVNNAIMYLNFTDKNAKLSLIPL